MCRSTVLVMATSVARPNVIDAVAPGEAGADVVLEDVSKTYGRVTAAQDVSFEVRSGEFVALSGRSGSGKSTLLHLIGGLDTPSSGRVLVNGVNVADVRRTATYRRSVVGFVFQLHYLLPDLTARQNVEMALLGAGVRRAERHRRALALLDEAGLLNRAEHLPHQLSGGERQRVAIARALANEPSLLLADEPTGALDSASARNVLDLLSTVRQRRGMTAIIVTHDAAVSARVDRTIYIADGRIVEEPDADAPL
jgi:ABC-type lipoprotein export system ATPase subunit